MNKHGVQDRGSWFEALKDLTPKALESGLFRLRQKNTGAKFMEFPPNCLQFRGLCLDFYDDLRLPKASDAYREIKNSAYRKSNRWSHEIVKYIAANLPKDFLNFNSEAEAYALFDSLYAKVCHLVRQGHPVPMVKEPELRIEEPNRELAQHHLQVMKKRLGALI